MVWNEYKNDRFALNYTLFKYNGTDLILTTLPNNDLYVKLTKTDYSIGSSLSSLYDPNLLKIPGSWLIEPIFPNGK